MSVFSLCLVGMPPLWLGLFGLVLPSLRSLMRLGSVSGGPLPSKGLVLVLRVVQLGGPWVRRARANAADALDAADVFLSCDSSVAPLLDMRTSI